MSPHFLDQAQQRVLGCLIEKQRTTPDQYPLSLNALRLACNQSSSRDPVLELEESEVHAAVQELGRIGWARLASGQGSRAVKYRHLLDEALDLDGGALSVLAVLLLRGPQTAAELKTRTERLHRFADGDEVAETLAALAAHEHVELLPRRPGQREERWRHLLGHDAAAAPGPEQQPEPDGLEQRLAQIEERLATLEDRLR
jgi:uncharacterized protein